MRQFSKQMLLLGLIVVAAGSGCRTAAREERLKTLAEWGHSPETSAPGNSVANDVARQSSTVDRLPPPDGMAQSHCPVTGAALGSMGPPVPVDVGSRTVYVCCRSCVGKLLEASSQSIENRAGAGQSGGAPATSVRRTSATGRPSAKSAGSCESGCCN